VCAAPFLAFSCLIMVLRSAMKGKRVVRPEGVKTNSSSPLTSPLGRKKLRAAFVQSLRQEEQHRRGTKVKGGHKEALKEQATVPWQERAGAPLVATDVSPEDWKTKEGKQVFVDFGRAPWLPDDCGQGVKMTNAIANSKVGGGGIYKVYVTSQGNVFYNKLALEAHLGRKFDQRDGFRGTVRAHMSQTRITSEISFFDLLSVQEQKCLPKADDIHFCVVSARRTQTPQGVSDIAGVVAAFRSQGVEPTWYVDAESVEDYRKIGLKAVVGGKLTPARNKALDDAMKLKKACVQCSDDISHWHYHHGEMATSRTDEAVNAAYAKAQCHVISPVAAARFMLAKMRATSDQQPRLAGVWPLSVCARGFGGLEFGQSNFILGDYFVADMSPVRFDDSMTLKEDYDFTCTHIQQHGSVLRCNRMTVMAKHQTNAGGACSVRDAQGLAEQRNIAILRQKWPGVFSDHPTRKNEVVLRWKTTGQETDDIEERVEPKTRLNGKQAVAKMAKLKAKKGKPTDAASAKNKKASTAAVTPLKSKKEMPADVTPPKGKKGLPMEATLVLTDKVSSSSYIATRCKQVAGLTIQEALKSISEGGRDGKYCSTDLRYDLAKGFLKFEGSNA